MDPTETTFDAALVRVTEPTTLAVSILGVRSDGDVARAYLASLPSPRSRQTMLECLGRAAVLLGVVGADDRERIEQVAWTQLHYAATAYVCGFRSNVTGCFAPS